MTLVTIVPNGARVKKDDVLAEIVRKQNEIKGGGQRTLKEPLGLLNRPLNGGAPGQLHAAKFIAC